MLATFFGDLEDSVAASSPGAYPHLEAWEWPVGLDLFLMSLAGGVLILTSFRALRRWRLDHGENRLSAWTDVLPPLCMLAGSFLLWIDLGARLQAFRFFLIFEPTSPMSWGSWIILLSLIGSLARLSQRARELEIPVLRGAIRGLAERADTLGRGLLWTLVALGLGLGLYTGFLLASLGARPLWANLLLPFFFVAYGLAAGAGVIELSTPADRKGRAHVALAGPAGLALVLGMGYAASTPGLVDALALGDGWMGPAFWLLGLGLGLFVPLLLEIGAGVWAAARPLTARLAPWLILVGGIAVRQALVYAGQAHP